MERRGCVDCAGAVVKFVCWTDPDKNGDPVFERISVDEAIARAKHVAKSKGYVYESDKMALEDFIVVHWAWIEDSLPEEP